MRTILPALFTKPFILRKLFDKYLPDGPYLTPLPTAPITRIGKTRHALSTISQKQKNPSVRDYQALIYLAHYLWNYQSWGIHLQLNRAEQTNTLVKLADATFAVYCGQNGSGKSQYAEFFDLTADDDLADSEYSTGMFYFRSIDPSTVDLFQQKQKWVQQ